MREPEARRNGATWLHPSYSKEVERFDRSRGMRVGAHRPAAPVGSPTARPETERLASTAGAAGATELSVADQAQDKAQQVAGEAQEKAQQAAGQARAQLREQIEQRSSQAAEQINQQASDLRTVSESLREQGKDGPAKAAERLAAMRSVLVVICVARALSSCCMMRRILGASGRGPRRGPVRRRD